MLTADHHVEDEGLQLRGRGALRPAEVEDHVYTKRLTDEVPLPNAVGSRRWGVFRLALPREYQQRES
jgi:hypothetical protein